MVNVSLWGDSGVRIRGKIGKAAIAAVAAASIFGLSAPVFAQERPEPSTVVVYGDASRGWVAEVQGFADVLDSRDRPEITTLGRGIRVASLLATQGKIEIGRSDFSMRHFQNWRNHAN